MTYTARTRTAEMQKRIVVAYARALDGLGPMSDYLISKHRISRGRKAYSQRKVWLAE